MENLVMWGMMAFFISVVAMLMNEAEHLYKEYVENVNKTEREKQWLLEAERSEDPDMFYHMSRIFSLEKDHEYIILDFEAWTRKVVALITILGVSLWWWM